MILRGGKERDGDSGRRVFSKYKKYDSPGGMTLGMMAFERGTMVQTTNQGIEGRHGGDGMAT